MFSVIWFISLYFVIVRRFICSSNLYSSVVVSSSLKKSIYFSNLIQNCFPIHYPDIQSEVEENITEASWLSCGSWGSSASKLEVDVDRVGPRLGEASGASSSTLLLFSPLVAILSEIFFCLLVSFCLVDAQLCSSVLAVYVCCLVLNIESRQGRRRRFSSPP